MDERHEGSWITEKLTYFPWWLVAVVAATCLWAGSRFVIARREDVEEEF